MQSDTIGITEFKANCLKLVAQVHKTRRTLIITKHGKPLAKVTPTGTKRNDYGFGKMKGTVLYSGDVLSPAFEEWEFNDNLI